MGNDENTKKESFNFKLIGGEKQVEDDEEGEEEQDDQDEGLND